MVENIKTHIKVVVISDTHCKQYKMNIPDGDILIHAGDFSSGGKPKEIKDFVDFIKFQKHKHKIVIAGNHDICLDTDKFEKLKNKFYHPNELENMDIQALKKSLADNCTYLEDSGVRLYGYNFYGSPYSVEFCGWAFMEECEDLAKRWAKIPTETDILITHGPPFEILDLCKNKQYAGCPYLRKEVLERVKPLYHIFGHIHEQYGTLKIDDTTFLNASSCNYYYKPNNPPIVFDLLIKEHDQE